MGCSLGNYKCWIGVCGTAADAPGSPVTGGPRLIVSNYPETVNADNMKTPPPNQVATSTLYRCQIELDAGTTRLRVFVWHVNQMGGSRVFSLFARVASGSGQVSDRRIVGLRSTNYPATGLCLAKVHLWAQWDAALSQVSLGESEAAIWQQAQVANNQLIGAVMEFDVVLTAAATLCMRTTVASGAPPPGNWDEMPAYDPGQHVRGYWPFSQLTLSGGSIDVKAVEGAPPTRVVQAVAAGGPEIAAFAKSSGDTYGTVRGNRGCYGADLRYDFEVTNTGTQGYPLFAYAQGRDLPGMGYFGPVSILSPGNYPKLGVTRLHCDGPNPNPGDYVRLTTSDGENETPVVIPNGQTLTYRIGAAVAGAASTPFNLVLRGMAYQLAEPPEV